MIAQRAHGAHPKPFVTCTLPRGPTIGGIPFFERNSNPGYKIRVCRKRYPELYPPSQDPSRAASMRVSLRLRSSYRNFLPRQQNRIYTRQYLGFLPKPADRSSLSPPLSPSTMVAALLQTVALFSISWLAWKLFHRFLARSPLDVLPGPPPTSFLFGKRSYTARLSGTSLLTCHQSGNIPHLYDSEGWDFHKKILENCTLLFYRA